MITLRIDLFVRALYSNDLLKAPCTPRQEARCATCAALLCGSGGRLRPTRVPLQLKISEGVYRDGVM